MLRCSAAALFVFLKNFLRRCRTVTTRLGLLAGCCVTVCTTITIPHRDSKSLLVDRRVHNNRSTTNRTPPPCPLPYLPCVCVNQHSITNASANGECRWCAGHDAKPRRISAKTLRRAYKSSYGGETKRRRDEETCTMWSFQD